MKLQDHDTEIVTDEYRHLKRLLPLADAVDLDHS